MPICEADPWRMQYFETRPCPDDVRIPTEDCDAWAWFPNHKWIYNKLVVAESQGLVCGPHGLEPTNYPVFSKPMINLRGMGNGSRILRSHKEYRLYQRPGHMWMPLLEGEHVSTDVAVAHGKAKWWRHAIGHQLKEGMFDYWSVLSEAKPDIEDYCGKWLSQHLADYTGMVNLETIGTRIIEVHLRFADQWPDLYSDAWIDALIRLYAKGIWSFRDTHRREGYSTVLFGAHGIQYRHPPKTLVADLLKSPEISSIQITFHEDQPPQLHAMPPGGFRLAIVNCWNLEAGRWAREELALSFWSTQTLIGKRTRRMQAANTPK